MKSILRRLGSLMVLAAGGLAVVGAPAQAEERSPVVVELFTSQGCYSCPPAEKYLGELAGHDGVLALEFHVDYWDDLVYGFAGKWKDPYSSPKYTRRQQVYNVQIRGRGGVYTPQMVINGTHEAVGSRRSQVARIISSESRRDTAQVGIKTQPRRDGGLNVALSVRDGARSRKPATVWLARFLPETTTQVRAGENKGKTLTSHHIVTSLEPIGNWSGGAGTFVVTPTQRKAGEGCAILVQEVGQGPILGAAYCMPKVGS